jgi:hypothetical protein
METLFEDKREISTVAMDEKNFIQVGKQGVTKIVPYQERGQWGDVTWLAVYKGEFLAGRLSAVGCVIGYKEEEEIK